MTLSTGSTVWGPSGKSWKPAVVLAKGIFNAKPIVWIEFLSSRERAILDPSELPPRNPLLNGIDLPPYTPEVGRLQTNLFSTEAMCAPATR